MAGRRSDDERYRGLVNDLVKNLLRVLFFVTVVLITIAVLRSLLF